jgi:hypothetical protein
VGGETNQILDGLGLAGEHHFQEVSVFVETFGALSRVLTDQESDLSGGEVVAQLSEIREEGRRTGAQGYLPENDLDSSLGHLLEVKDLLVPERGQMVDLLRGERFHHSFVFDEEWMGIRSSDGRGLRLKKKERRRKLQERGE